MYFYWGYKILYLWEFSFHEPKDWEAFQAEAIERVDEKYLELQMRYYREHCQRVLIRWSKEGALEKALFYCLEL